MFVVQFALWNACKYEEKIKIKQNKKQATAGKFSNAKVILFACKIFENSVLIIDTVPLISFSFPKTPKDLSFSGAFSHEYQYLGINQGCKSSRGMFPK